LGAGAVQTKEVTDVTTDSRARKHASGAAGMHVYLEDDELIEAWQWKSPPLRALDDLVLDLIGDPPARVLDLGCGSGRLSAALGAAGFEVDGIDVEERAVELGHRILERHRISGVHLYAGDVFDPAGPVAAGEYDAVVCVEVLEHVDMWRQLLEQGVNMLRPGGWLIITVPRDPRQFTMLDEYGGHLRRFRDDELLDQIRNSCDDFTVRRPGWPMMRSIVWVYTRALRFLGRTYDTEARTLWRDPGFAKRSAIWLTYRLLKFDDLFDRLPYGTHLVVRARKRSLPA
jgi:2-polyprenyl-3-methyl-5-hydroxy-6-metoxy-1,4-benzoquinol methylase